MDNSKSSDTSRQDDKPAASNGRLSETIANRMQDARGSLLRSPRADDAARLARSTQISEILDRQRILANARPAPSTTPNVSLADQIRERLRSPAAAPSAAAAPAAHRTSDFRTPSAEQATVDISEALAKLRSDIKQDLAASFSQEIASLRQEIKDIGSSVAQNGYPADLYGDLQRLADSMEFLTEATESAASNGVRDEIDALKAMVGGMARQDDIAVLAEHFEILRQQLTQSDANSQVKDLDAKIVNLADAIEMFVSQMSSADRDLNTHMHSLDDRLADIAAAIDANALATAELSGDAGFGSLEARVARLIEEIDQVNLQQSNGVTERIEALATRMEELAKLQANENLDRRFDELAELIKSGAAGSGEALNEVISDISRKIEDMAQGTVGSALIDRFDALVGRIDALDASGASSGMSDEILAWLDERMNDIAARIDESAKSTGNPAADLGVLEEQIATLTKLLSEPGVAGNIDTAAMSSRMAALEDYMSTNDEYVVEAARQAAETALEAYVRNFAGQANGAGVSAADVSMISGLASDLHALEELTRSGEARNQQTFETLQQTLVQIAERLDQLGQSAQQATTTSAQVKAPAVARSQLRTGTDAEMFGHDFDDDDLFDDDIAVGSGASSVGGAEGGKSAKNLFATISKRLRPNPQDEKAEEPRRKVDTPPAIDAADDISPDIANQLLEPGSGAPDIRQILEKVRAVQEGKPAKNESAAARDDEDSDYIAVARRAAQAAAAEMGPSTRAEDGAEGSTSTLAKYRRPLLLGTGLVLLAVMSWPLVNTLFQQPNPPAQKEISALKQDTATASTSTVATGADKQTGATDAKPETAQPAGEAATATDAPKPAETKAAEPATAPAAASTDAPAKDLSQGPSAGAAADQPQPSAAAPATESGPAAASEGDATQAPAKPDAADAHTSAAPVAATPAASAASAELTAPAGIEPAALVEAAKGNDPLAIFEVGNRIFDGRGVKADPAAALAWYEKSAALGFAPAEYRLGSMYEKGVGVSIDPSKAVDHYLTAAKAGNVSAMHNLAVLYATGTLGAPDFTSAAKWFTDAANHGVRDSQFNLAILYAKGSGVTQDLVQSYKWFDIAAKDGDVDAAQKRDEVGKVLTGDQMTKAKAEVESWKALSVDDKANATVIPDAWAGKPQKTSSIDMKKAITYIQAMLNKNGFDVGRPDGVMGAKTVAAIKQFQTSVGQQPTGEINDALVKELIARSK